MRFRPVAAVRRLLVRGGTHPRSSRRLKAVRHPLVVLLAVFALVVAACSNDQAGGPPKQEVVDEVDGSSEQDRLDAARARWEASGIEDYAWTYEWICFCVHWPVRIVVEDGVAVSQEVHPDETLGTAPGKDLEILTVPDLFDFVQTRIGRVDSLTVEYDPDGGQVLRVAVDPSEDVYDDEIQYVVCGFEPRRVEGQSLTRVTPPTAAQPAAGRCEPGSIRG